ncbi:cell division control protein 48 [Haladaptatus paucihalophilus DX253]|uniref:Cell division control protein 48 n=1 Tax=Haladaptatus paucihalophilus DX253 TaxID=797209 RepID=E7QUP2_HALPU|nr:CDC48 family AAA ATPase [Haladaptatus paucihalophilus]EFW91699.1 cell division control protein 48 [Haladaptatus paucihalophilus DX253]SHJ96709.1 transitional endoplasmic reticulum ATPase [Haladaptatus paucihalophilus DX253]
MTNTPTVTLTVRGAEKRDGGRGIARIADEARQQLGVLSGDTVAVEGNGTTVVKVWPAASTVPENTIQIDAETRTNAGVRIGDEVSVRPISVSDADSITVVPKANFSLDDVDTLERAVKRELLDRPVQSGERARIERLGDAGLFVVTRTNPGGTVRVTNDTNVKVSLSDMVESVSTSSTDADDSTDVTGAAYEDIGGLDDELRRVREMVELPLSNPELFRRLGIDPPKGVLLYGPPGTGKTLIAKAVANEVNAHFVSVSGPEVMSKYKGESEERLREIFTEANENAPAIIFFDEVDSLGGKRDEESDMENRLVAQMLSLMDGLESRGEVVVIGATNRVDAIDPALRRGGRFDREIEIGAPDEGGRREILEVHTRGMPLADDVAVERLAATTHGFVGADLHTLVTEAAMAALRRARDDGADDDALLSVEVTRGDFNTALASVEPSAMREFVAEAPDISFEDVGGLNDAKQTLIEAVEWPLSYSNLFEATRTEPPSGVLLYGPPGTGKTLLARALAGESDVNFVSVAGPELLDRYVGESEKSVREVFDRARQASPAIIFFDEIDALASQRGESHEVTERVVSQLLTELDGLTENPNLVVLAATNRREAIDPALLRPGRLESHIEIPAPGEEGRRKILSVHAGDKPLADDIDLDWLATELEGYTGADIEALVRAASMRAIREAADELTPEEANERADEIVIEQRHFDAAREFVQPTL